jgi:NAD(P)-dependent dehydrogenase (short-subunit alcohol dehydrogenase family)
MKQIPSVAYRVSLNNISLGDHTVKTVLITNVTQYTGPGAIKTLHDQGARVICHDRSFGDKRAVSDFMTAYPHAICLRESDPVGIVSELTQEVGTVDAVVSNDAYPTTRALIEDVSLEDLRMTFESVRAFPFHLAQLLLPGMKSRGNGCFVFVTSARQLRPEPGFSVPTSIRAGTTAFVQALSKEVAAFGIQVNVVAPNYLYSEMYYPRARFVDDEDGRRIIADTVPAGRLGTPEEVGELIAFLVSGKCKFVTGQVIYFTGGWP